MAKGRSRRTSSEPHSASPAHEPQLHPAPRSQHVSRSSLSQHSALLLSVVHEQKCARESPGPDGFSFRLQRSGMACRRLLLGASCRPLPRPAPPRPSPSAVHTNAESTGRSAARHTEEEKHRHTSPAPLRRLQRASLAPGAPEHRKIAASADSETPDCDRQLSQNHRHDSTRRDAAGGGLSLRRAELCRAPPARPPDAPQHPSYQ